MSESQRATEIVHQAVEGLRLRGRASRASAEVLQRLAATAGAVPKAGAAAEGAAAAARNPASGVSREGTNFSTTAAKPAAQHSNGSGAARSDLGPRGDVPRNEPAPAARVAETTGTTAKVPGPVTPAQAGEDAEISGPARATKIAPHGGTKAERLAAMRGPVLACVKCPHLVKSRTQVVFGVGNPEAELMFVGEAPGADEDLVGEPFVGKAGQLLTKIIETMGFRRNEVYIANVLKCRPNMPPGESGNRKPTGAEMNTCKPYLMEQIEIIQPKVLVGLGGTAMEGLLGIDKFFVTRERGQWHEFAGIPLMPTFHPSYLLRNQALTEKRKTWEDMLAVLEKLGREISEKQRGYFLKA